MTTDRSGSERLRERFDGIATHEGLVGASRAYCARAVREYDLAVDLDRVDWEVSTRAKRRAAAVKRPKIPGAEVGVPFDWEGSIVPADAAGERDGDPRRGDGVRPGEQGGRDEKGWRGEADRPGDAFRRCTVSLTWTAFREFSAAEWAATLRHELVHVEQFQAFGTTDHGRRFRRRAGELDTAVRCRSFGTPKYLLTCGDCGDLVARRYRECKLVREHDRYVSGCCDAPLRCERPGSRE
jgi:predicted SprT family Zn-dependent metalloprotease